MTAAEQTSTFLLDLFSTTTFSARVEVRNVVSGRGSTSLEDPRDARRPSLEDLGEGEWYFGVTTRDSRGGIVGSTLVWCDVDKCPDPDALSDDAPVYPEPSAVVSSGHGTHLYWRLTHTVAPELAVRLASLATFAYHGDPQVVEPKRVMRLPGSFNRKESLPVECQLYSQSGATYDPEELETALVARAVAPVWLPGARNSVLMGLAAVLSRAGWSEERLQDVTRTICELTDDDDPINNRVTTALTTSRKFGLGEAVTAEGLREAFGDRYRAFLDALGITAHDGDLVVGGEVVGKLATLERDFLAWVSTTGTWGFADGTVVRWVTDHWRVSSEQELASWLFSQLARLKVLQNGDEADFGVTTRLANQMVKVMVGNLQQREVAPLADTLLPLRNGVLDLEALTLRPHDPTNGNRWVVNLTYDPNATCPDWERFLSEAVPEEASFLQEWVGYCLHAGNPYERMLWLYGPSGTGKSTFIKTFTRLFGPAAVAINVDNITPYTVASVAPARVAVCTEMSARMLRTITLKALVSGDPVDGRHPYGRPFSVSFTGKFVCASNALPPVDQGEGLWRRVAILSFTRRPQVPDEGLGSRLVEQLPGILNWAIAGLRRLRTGTRWELPKAVSDVVSEYREATDMFGSFAEEELDFSDRSVETPIKEIYVRYTAWMQDRSSTPIPLGPSFYHELRSHGAEPVHSPVRVGGRLVRCWRGVALREEVF